MTAASHAVLRDYLFPGDGLEAAAVLVCNRGTGRLGRRLLVSDIRHPPYESCDRRPDAVVWPFAEVVSPSLISSLDRLDQSLITIHSHPIGEARFSATDDRNDREVLSSVSGWFDDGRPHGAAVMAAGGTIAARTLDGTGTFRVVDTVAVVGDEIKSWKARAASSVLSHEVRLRQTFGRGTLDFLRGLRAGVVGCSGTGSILIELLSRNGVGELVIVDDDTLDALNLNRVVNGVAEDAARKRPKVLALKEAVERIGIGTVVHAYESATDSGSVVKALVDCDVIFGCVDSAFGRYHLDCLASAYLIPYFDVGVNLDADGDGGIFSADAVAHYVHPGGSSLLSRGAYTMDQVTAELWRRADPEYYNQQRLAGYLQAVGDDEPAVISLNMQAACLAFNDFLARVTGFRLDSDGEFTTQRFRLVHGSFENESSEGRPHRLFRPYVGAGDRSVLVQNNTTDA